MEVNSNEIVNGMSAIMPGQIWFFEIGDRSPVCTMTKNRPHLILSSNSREIVCLPLTHQNSANSNWKVPVINSDKGTISYILVSRPVTLYIDDIRARMRYYTTLSPKLFQKVTATFMAAMFGAYYGDDISRVANEAVEIFNAKNEYDYMAFMPYDYYSIDGVMSKINTPATTTAPVEAKSSEPETDTDEFKNKLIDSLRELGIDIVNLNKIVKSTEETTKEPESMVSDTTKPQQVKSAKSPKIEAPKAEKEPDSIINLDDYITMAQAVKAFNLTRGSAEYMAQNIETIKNGKLRMMRKTDCENFLANKQKHKPYKRNAADAKISTATAVAEDTETDEREQIIPIKIKNRKEFVKGMLIPVCELDKKTSTSIYEIANTFKHITGNEMPWTEAKGIMNNLCIENHDIRHRDFSSTEFSVKLTTQISEGQKKLKAEQIIRDIRNYGEDVAKRKWNIDDKFIESNCKETACK